MFTAWGAHVSDITCARQVGQVQKFIVNSAREVPVAAVWCIVFALAGRAGSATGVRFSVYDVRMAGGEASGTGVRFGAWGRPHGRWRGLGHWCQV